MRSKYTGSLARWEILLPSALLLRVETFYFNRATNKRIYGYRSQLFKTLLQAWADEQEKHQNFFFGTGKRRHDSPQLTRVKFAIPLELSDRIVSLIPSAGTPGPIYGFRSQLMTTLLERWVSEQETKLLSLHAG